MPVDFRGFTITDRDVTDAMDTFDRQHPDPSSYKQWLAKENYKYAVQYRGRLYPPKHLLGQMTGMSLTDFSGGEESNRVFRNLGFQVTSIRNPSWTRDELILALDLYFRHSPSTLSQSHREVIELSQLLNQLPIHGAHKGGLDFRNPNSVYMKLGNFLSLDPSYQGKGLSAGSKLDQEVWDEFSGEKTRLRDAAQAIRQNFRSLDPADVALDDEDEEFSEGRVLTRLHKVRERDRTMTNKKKDQVLAATGKLACEVCGFDFAEVYGDLGRGFAECHHTKPVASLRPGETTKLSELAIICANCHRMVHRRRGLLSISELKELYRPRS